MTYAAFKRLVLWHGYTLAQLRCDVRPTREILDLIERVGHERYERYVLLYESGK